MCNFLVTFPQSIFYSCLTDSVSEKNYFNHYTVALSIQIDVTINHKIIATFRNRQLCLGIIVFSLRGLYTYTSPKSNCCSGPLKYILTQNHWFINAIHCSILILWNTYILVPPIWLGVSKILLDTVFFPLLSWSLPTRNSVDCLWKFEKNLSCFCSLRKVIFTQQSWYFYPICTELSDLFSLTWNNYYWRE